MKLKVADRKPVNIYAFNLPKHQPESCTFTRAFARERLISLVLT